MLNRANDPYAGAEKHRFHWLALHRGPDGKSTRPGGQDVNRRIAKAVGEGVLLGLGLAVFMIGLVTTARVIFQFVGALAGCQP